MKKIIICLLMLAALASLAACGKHTHKRGLDYVGNETHHWYACQDKDCQEKIGQAPHNWRTERVLLAPTKDKEGIKEYICSECYTTKQEKIPYVAKKTVNSTEWDVAFNTQSLKNVTVEITDINYSDSVEHKRVYSIQGDDTVVYVTITTYINGEEVGYLAKYQEGYYQWTMESRDTTVENGSFSMVPYEDVMQTQNTLKDYSLDLSGLFNSFTYQGVNGAYTASDINGYTSVTVSLADGEVREVIALDSENGSVSIKLTGYGSTVPTPPRSKAE